MTPIRKREALKVEKEFRSDFEFCRYGEPLGTVKFDKVKGDRIKLLKHYYSRGYNSYPREIDPEFRKHVAYFRCCLDFWEQFSTTKVFSKDEIYVRCLEEGISFTEKIKKSRATCLRAKTTETVSDIDEDEYFEEYDGYNSIIHERYLIHWDDTESIDDIKYAFIPVKEVDDKLFRKLVRNLFDDFRIREAEPPEDIDMLSEMKNTKMYDPKEDRAFLMRSFWREGITTNSSYFAKRTVVPVEPGSTRDTGIGDPSTILKVKILNKLARIVSERLPYSANTDAKTANSRFKRVLKRNAFLHLDFKKFGLTFPRQLMNIVIQEIGSYIGFDTRDLIIKDMTVQIGTECFKTERGTMLGWLDSINSIAVCAILHDLVRKGIEMDFITFNDDVEISMRARDVPGKLELLRSLVIGVIDSFDIPISLKKTYGSRASVFLERYVYFDRHYDLDMYKEQLTVKAYAQSCTTRFPWKAKMLFSAAEQWTKSEYANDRCRDTCDREFSQMEYTESLWAGGWFIKMKDGLDMSLVEGFNKMISLGSKLQRWKTPNYTQRDFDAESNEKIQERIEKKQFLAENPREARQMFHMEETIEELNLESYNVMQDVIIQGSQYTGSDKELPDKVMRILDEYRGPIDWGPLTGSQ
jgi:hypothetical protein